MSKPELVIQDWGGAHNADLNKMRARLIKGGSWKKQRIVVLIPAGDMIPAKVVLSWLNLGFPPNQPAARILAQGMEVVTPTRPHSSRCSRTRSSRRGSSC